MRKGPDLTVLNWLLDRLNAVEGRLTLAGRNESSRLKRLHSALDTLRAQELLEVCGRDRFKGKLREIGYYCIRCGCNAAHKKPCGNIGCRCAGPVLKCTGCGGFRSAYSASLCKACYTGKGEAAA